MVVGIYGIFDKTNDECLYVGQTIDTDLRWQQHLKLLKSRKHPRQAFVSWYHNGTNCDVIDFRVLEECKNDKLNILEIKWFNLLSPKFYGKKPSMNEKWEHSDETKDKIRDSINKRNLLNGTVSEKRCTKCDSKFYGSVNSKICSDCKNRKKITSKCAVCDKTISNTRRSKIYCSRDCKVKAFRENNPDWKAPGSSYKKISKCDLNRLYTIEKLGIKEICDFFDCKERTIYYQLKRFNIPKRRNK